MVQFGRGAAGQAAATGGPVAGPSRLQLKAEHVEGMIAHARREAPRECCGLGIGRGERIERVVPVTNIAKHPTTRYEADPRELIVHFRQMDERGEELVAIYHSHPASPPLPSPTDLSLAYYPESVYLIVSLADAARPTFRAWRLLDGRPEAVPCEVEPSA